MIKKSLAFFSLTSCEGCQFETLNYYEKFFGLLDLYEIKNFRLGQEDSLPGPFDVSVVEGSCENLEQKKLLREVRKHSKVVIGLGACAHLGGIQSERNKMPFNLSEDKVKSIDTVIKVDYFIPGCPSNHDELYECLIDIYWGKTFTLPELSVCVECRQNENECLLKKKKLCLGPVTRSGCNSVCTNNGESCLGCRGPITQPNNDKLAEYLGEIGEYESIYGLNNKITNK